MGHKEELLAGARRCLYERGYAHTTARDIVAASGTNLASIGYHFGSKEALLNAAIVEGIEEWGARLEEILRADESADVRERLTATWEGMIESFGADRPLWMASIEGFMQGERNPELRRGFADGYEDARGSFPELAGVADPAWSDERTRQVGAVLLSLMVGLMLQWLMDPHRAPAAQDLLAGLDALAARVSVADR